MSQLSTAYKYESNMGLSSRLINNIKLFQWACIERNGSLNKKEKLIHNWHKAEIKSNTSMNACNALKISKTIWNKWHALLSMRIFLWLIHCITADFECRCQSMYVFQLWQLFVAGLTLFLFVCLQWYLTYIVLYFYFVFLRFPPHFECPFWHSLTCIYWNIMSHDP